MSEDGEHLAYVKTVGAGQLVVTERGPGPVLTGCARPAFAPVTNRLFYWTASPGGEPDQFGIMVDGAQLPPAFAEPGRLIFSRDGKRWAAIGGRAKQGPAVLFVDGKEVGRYKDASVPAFSDDGAHLAWLIQRDDDRIALMVDDHEERVFPAPEGRVSPAVKAKPVGPNLTPQFGVRYLSDGSLIVVAQDTDGWAIFRNGERLASYRHNLWLGGPLAVSFGQDFRTESSFANTVVWNGDRAAVAAWWERPPGEFDRWHVVRNGASADEDVCDDFWNAQPIVLSNDGRRTAYYCFKLVPGTTGEGDVVVDGRHYGPFRAAFGLVFSDDGSHFAYGGWNGQRQLGWTLYRDDGQRVAGPFDTVWRPRFDSKGVHLAWEVQRGGRNILGVDRRPLASFDEILWGPEFEESGYVSWVIRRGRNVRRLSALVD